MTNKYEPYSAEIRAKYRPLSDEEIKILEGQER